ncbi:XdhC family protein [Glycomyces buryatensis]|uniref:XdhC family protein n=1 Tax=Glycomyces buryatensis TaxID=2570927 RepID=A0A4S8PVS0_9ACTN|nr:XdhC/CoxI family protein [Glycomyces buryatensis]THV35608.1 XdhC family protein [Glycomyces buryatensis]
MKEIATQLRDWMREGRPFALASLVGVSGSAPRPLGTALAVDGRGAVVGGVSGGCVEAAVYTRCQEILESGQAAVESFGYSDEDAFAVGLTCGGSMDVLIVRVEADDAAIAAALDAIIAGEAVTLYRAVEGPDLGAALAIGGNGFTGTLEIGAADLPATSGRDGRFAVEVYAPPPRLLVYGAVDFAAPVARAAKFCGFDVTVCDARSVFATELRFPDADRVIVDWPHRHFDKTTVDERTAVCVLTHDEKFDIPLLERALVSKAGYVGAMGSRRTHQERLARLRENGVTEAELARLHAPIGLDLGGRTAEETALSILAEIVAVRNGANAGFLTTSTGPIHH